MIAQTFIQASVFDVADGEEISMKNILKWAIIAIVFYFLWKAYLKMKG